MKRTLASLLIAALSATAFADLGDDVRCREIGFSRSVESRDFDAFLSFIDTDARFVGGSVARGPEEIGVAWQVFFEEGGPKIRWRPQFVEVLQDGTLALSRGPYQMLSSDEDGTTREQWGTYNSVWRLQSDGRWTIIFDAGSSATESPPEAVRALLDEEDDCDD